MPRGGLVQRPLVNDCTIEETIYICIDFDHLVRQSSPRLLGVRLSHLLRQQIEWNLCRQNALWNGLVLCLLHDNLFYQSAAQGAGVVLHAVHGRLGAGREDDEAEPV